MMYGGQKWGKISLKKKKKKKTKVMGLKGYNNPTWLWHLKIVTLFCCLKDLKASETHANYLKLLHTANSEFASGRQMCQKKSKKKASPCDICDMTRWGEGPSSLSYTGWHPRRLCSSHKQGIVIWEGRDRGIPIGWRTTQL